MVKVRAWEMPGSTPAAMKCARTLPASLGAPVFYAWIPRSLMEHVSTRDNGGIWPEVIITLPAWKARQLNLEEVA